MDGEEGGDKIADYVIKELDVYEQKNLSKFIGAGLPYDLLQTAPTLCSRLWLELDTVPITIMPELDAYDAGGKEYNYWEVKCIDEQADSMARKCIM